jgi:hypothetical protein
MNKNTTNLNQNPEQLTEQQLNELENDAVWSLITETKKHSTVEVSPMFSRNVMREIRLNHSSTSAFSLFGRFNKVALGLGLAVAAACVALSITHFSEDNSNNDPLATSQESVDELNEILIQDELDEFTEEITDISSQDPLFITAEEIEIVMQM